MHGMHRVHLTGQSQPSENANRRQKRSLARRDLRHAPTTNQLRQTDHAGVDIAEPRPAMICILIHLRLPRLALIQRIGELIGVLYVRETAFWFRMGVDTAATTFTGIQTKNRFTITTQLPFGILGV